MLKLVCYIFIALSLTTASSYAQQEEGVEKKYSKLTKTEKTRLHKYRKEKIGCVQEIVLKNDNGTVDPVRLARTYQDECSYLDGKMKSDIVNSMFMSQKFADGFVENIGEELKYQLVPFILKKREEKRLGIKHPDPNSDVKQEQKDKEKEQ